MTRGSNGNFCNTALAATESGGEAMAARSIEAASPFNAGEASGGGAGAHLADAKTFAAFLAPLSKKRWFVYGQATVRWSESRARRSVAVYLDVSKGNDRAFSRAAATAQQSADCLRSFSETAETQGDSF
jgi:hypothetical protein